jgi:hypothetical protein
VKHRSERKRVPPRFNAACFCTSSEEAAELQSMAEVLTIHRIALSQWKALRAARLESGVVQSLADARLRAENDYPDTEETSDLRPDPESAACTELLGRAVKDDCAYSRAYVRVAASTAVADRDFHRCLAYLDHVRDLRAAGRYVPRPADAGEAETAPLAPAVFAAA